MNTFAGTWKDQSGVTITIDENQKNLVVKMGNGRGPFAGFEVDLYAPVISVNFTDDKPFTGVLSQDGKKILWNNDTVWSR